MVVLSAAACLVAAPRGVAAAPAAPNTATAPSAAAARTAGRLTDVGDPNVYLDVPPATAYDRLGEAKGLALAPESLGLIATLGRTVMALAATLALIYLVFKLLWPRLVARVAAPRQQTLRLTERLALDSKNSLLAVEHRDGRRYLLACGEHGCVVVDREAAPTGGPTTEPTPTTARRAGGSERSFGDVLAQPDAGAPEAFP